MKRIVVLAVALCCVAQFAAAANAKSGLSQGTPDIKSAGPLAFGPDGILFVGDTKEAAIYAIDTGDKAGSASAAKIEVANIKEAIAGLLGVKPAEVMINDLAVNPASGNVFLSVTRGTGTGSDTSPIILKVDASGKLSEVSLKNASFAKAALPNAPAPGGEGKKNSRAQSITDLAYVDGRVFIAGLSNEEFASTLRSIAFPFEKVESGTGVEIFHGAHGRLETGSPVRTFVPITIKGEAHLLAAYTCTPLVKLRVADLKSGGKVKGTTIAELGNGNQPLDMIVYQRDGKDFLLIANSKRGVMKVSTDNAATQEAITTPIKGTAGLKYDTIAQLKGVTQLDRLNDRNAVVLMTDEKGADSLKTVELP
jgi:hypothetical protein